MASDYQHCLMLMEEILPNEDWGRIYDEWGDFSDLDDGDNEPFALLRKAITQLHQSREWNRQRVDLLVVEQKNMRDPERTTVCNIIANGKAKP